LEFRIVFGSVPGDDREIAVLTRSIYAVLGQAGSGVAVPNSDIRQRRASNVDARPVARESHAKSSRGCLC
jgi:hypothetical protein